MVDYHPRSILPELLAALRDTPVVLLHGARQTGKTTLARHVAASAGSERRYITLDDGVTLAAARSDPAGFLEGLQGRVVIDEIQRAPELFLPLKAAVDRSRQPGRFLLTGSASVLSLPHLSDSLAGRMEILTLWPFSQGERDGVTENFIDALFAGTPLAAAGIPSTALWERVLAGGYPPALERTDPERRHAWFGAYLTTILERDVRDLANLEGLYVLPRLLALAASRAAGLLNLTDLARGLSIPQTTLKRYFALLEAIFLVRLLPAWSANLGRRLIKAPKLLVTDTGLAAHLLGMDGVRLDREPGVRGALLENFVAMELLKQTAWSRQHPSLYHFRTPGGQEVDLVLENRAGDIVGIEVKASATVDARAFAGLRALATLAGERFRRGVVLYQGSEAVRFGPQLDAIPVTGLWSQSGRTQHPEPDRPA